MATMVPVARYLLADAARSQRWFAPVVTDLVVVGATYAVDAGPPLEALVLPAAALLPLGAWITIAVTGAEDAVLRGVTRVACGGAPRAHAGRLLAAIVPLFVLALVTYIWPFVANGARPHPPAYQWRAAAIIVAMAVAGLGLGALCGPPSVRGTATSVALVLGISLVALVSGPITPVAPLLRLAGTATSPAGAGVAHLSALVGAVAGVGMIAAALSCLLARYRRD
jgi:hypothetical protein